MNKRKAQIRMDLHDDYLSGIKTKEGKKPNIVLVFVDDMGYGDLSCFGSEAIHTPNLDALAEDGAKMNNFYASSPICSPSRFSCLTGRYPTRGYVDYVFFAKNALGRVLNRIVFPYGVKGILPDEITIPEALSAGGYKTGMFGKWHLGDCSPYLPNEKGFDYFFGSYYSNDMKPFEYYRNQELVMEDPIDQTQLTKKLCSEICSYIDDNKDDPFFAYYASPFPHNPVHASEEFTGKSKGGAYGDCVEELDWSVGEIRKKLDEHNLSDNTLIIFTSDNGPWYEGNPGLHRGRKNNSFDGGQMVPFIACWPAQIPSNTSIDETAMNIDFFPTFLNLAGIDMPQDREIDGSDMMPLLKGVKTESVHENLYFIRSKKVFAVRTKDNFKYWRKNRSENSSYAPVNQGPFLFNLDCDQNESYNVLTHFPEKSEELKMNIQNKQAEMKQNPRGWK